MTKNRDFRVKIGLFGGCRVVLRGHPPILRVLDAEKGVVEKYGGIRGIFFPWSW